MEADWEFEIGGSAPVIEAQWVGFVDLRADPARAGELLECCELPALGDALRTLNQAGSPVWTSKTDVFTPDPIDPDELDAAPGCSGAALACYIDLLPCSDQQWSLPFKIERDCRGICERLREFELRCCRIDLIIRRVYISSDVNDLGMTTYLTACGTDAGAAKRRLSECLTSFAGVVARNRNGEHGSHRVGSRD